MKKPIRRKTSAKNTRDTLSAKRTASKNARSQSIKASVGPEIDGRLTLNHAMIYVKDVERGLGSSSLKTFATRISRCMRVCARRVGMGRSLCIRRVRRIPFRAMVCACTSKSGSSTSSAANSSKRTSTSLNCHASCSVRSLAS